MSPSRRLAAIFAADVVGFSSLMGGDEEGTFRALQVLRSVVDPILAGHEGRIANTAGDSIIAEFASVAQAVDAAVEIQRNNEAHATGLLLRIGVNLGDVIVTDEGDIFGDGVNIAARLEAEAPAGGIVISGSVRDSLRGRSPVTFEDLGARHLKNIEEPMRLFQAVLDAPEAPTTAAPTVSNAGPELLERFEELEALRGRIAAAASGRGSVVVVSGEAGIGKSALLRGVAASAGPEVHLAWGWCDDLVTPRPLGPFRDMAPSLGHEFGTIIRSHRAPDDVLQALHSVLASGPTRLLVVEDVHWADDATLDAITFLSRRIEHLPAVLAITTRDEGLARSRTALANAPAGVIERIHLSPLSARAIAQLSGDPASAETVRRLTGGNPFFVSEMLAAGVDSVPASVQDTVLARIDRLSDRARSLAQLVSVSPTRLELEFIESIVPGSGPALDEAEAANLLVVLSEGVGYRHELARRAVETSLHARELQTWHRLVLGQLAEAHADPARLVHHAEGAGDDQLAVRYALVAAPTAASAGAHREAAAHYERALAHEDQLSETELQMVLSGYSRETYLLDRREPAVNAAQRLLEIHRTENDAGAVGDDLRWLSRLYWWQGKGAAARLAADEAIDILEPLGRTRALAMAYSNRAQLAMLEGDDLTTIEWGERGLRLASDLGDEATTVHVMINLATVRVRTDPVGAAADLRTARERADAIGDTDSAARAWTNLTWTLLLARRYDEARSELDQLLEYTESRELDAFRTYTLGQLALLATETGHWEDAARYAASSYDGRALSNVGKVPALGVLTLLAARQGRFDEASTFADEAWELAESSGEMQRIGPIASARSELAWLLGEEASIPGIALPVLERAIEIGDRRHVGELHRWLRFAGHDVSDNDEEEPYSTESRGDHVAAAEEWLRLGARYDAALALHQAGRDEEAATVLTQLGAHGTLRRIQRRPIGTIDL